MDVIKKVSQFIKEYSILNDNQSFLIAVSGGVDSIALLDIIYKLFPKNRKVLIHIDHSIRNDTFKDIELIKKVSKKYKIKHYIKRVDVLKYCKEKKLGIEEGARELRYKELKKIFAIENLDVIITAHNLNDLAENFLMRVIRGSGLDGLPGMNPINKIFAKPMLSIPKKDIILYAKDNGLHWREDYTNKDFKYTRNSIRFNLLPLMIDYNPKFLDSILRLSKILWMHHKFVEKEIDRIRLQKDSDGILINIDTLKNLPKYLSYELIKKTIEKLNGSIYGFEFESIESIFNLMDSKSGAMYEKQGITVLREYQNLTFLKTKNFKEKKKYYIELYSYGKYCLDGCLLSIQKPYTEKFCDFPVIVRNYEKADKIKIKNGHKKISKLLSDKKVAIHTRKNVLIVLNKNDGIISVINCSNLNKLFENKKGLIIMKECETVEKRSKKVDD